jgi:hypothetical protein
MQLNCFSWVFTSSQLLIRRRLLLCDEIFRTNQFWFSFEIQNCRLHHCPHDVVGVLYFSSSRLQTHSNEDTKSAWVQGHNCTRCVRSFWRTFRNWLFHISPQHAKTRWIFYYSISLSDENTHHQSKSIIVSLQRPACMIAVSEFQKMNAKSPPSKDSWNQPVCAIHVQKYITINSSKQFRISSSFWYKN